MKEQLIPQLIKVLSTVGIDADSAVLDLPDNPEHGDYSTNAALTNAKKLKTSPKVLADKIVAEFKKEMPDFVESVEVAGVGFVNFRLKDEAVMRAALGGDSISASRDPISSKPLVMVEYTDPNPFKEFHIGHLMANAIGESISRLVEHSEKHVIRANWQGDVGPHVAKAIWGAMTLEKEGPGDFNESNSKASYWGRAYVKGAEAYETSEDDKREIDTINKKVYDRSDPKINELYEKGRRESLDAFENIYKRLDTKFDNYFFEGTEGRNGEQIVKDFLARGIFEESDGAIIFRGEKYGLHTRVFITSNGLPTYEAKELGLNTEKFKIYPNLSQSIIITANEQSDYFKVLLKVFELIAPNIAEKTKHIAHGMMRFASGKMSSRKGNVISGEGLIDEIKKMVKGKISESQIPGVATLGTPFKKGDFARQDMNDAEKEEIADIVAVGAIKYTILRQAIGGDIVFDSAKSISFEGDSGPYLQYSAVRANTVLKKAVEKGLVSVDIPDPSLPPRRDEVSHIRLRLVRHLSPPATVETSDAGNASNLLARLIIRFPDVVSRATSEYAPHHVANYLIALAGEFNSFYARQTIVDDKDPLSPYYVALTRAFLKVMREGLWLLGIRVPERM